MSSDNSANRVDACTLSDCTPTHLVLDWSCDFSAKSLRGVATWTVTTAGSTLTLDTKDLTIERVTVGGAPAEFSLLDEVEPFGKPLRVEVGAAGAHEVAIHYATSPESSAIQWLEPALTAGKVRPYVFTQCQAIHARALLPCADTPSAKFTYEATVAVPAWATAVMSAVGTGAKVAGAKRKEGGAAEDTRSFGFEQKCAIPSYLLALAVGELEARSVGPRSQVWSEPSMVAAAEHEFAETEKFIAAAEAITGQPYVWGRYDILCLPPSFPYGGMENPCLTFVTPTLLAGDRSLADVVAHEVSHSWTGNLVTNHTWEHFWLNEGWTVWLERSIKARMTSPAMFDFCALSGLQHLHDDLAHFGHDNALTALNPKLEGIDPDDAFSSVPYEKGFNFLVHLSTKVGAAGWADFVKAYIGRFKFTTLTSADFRSFFDEWSAAHGHADAAATVDWGAWLSTPGPPPADNSFSNELGARCVALAEKWLAPPADGAAADAAPAGCAASDVGGWSSAELQSFLEHLIASVDARADALPAARLGALDSLYGLSATRNSEVRFRWQRLCIALRADFIVPDVVAFVTSMGRMKFVRPLYRALAGWPEQKAAAASTFAAHADSYHPIARKMLAQDLKA